LTASEFYEERVRSLGLQIEHGQGVSRRLGMARGAIALPGIALILLDIMDDRMPWGSWQFGCALMFAFLVVATWHENLQWHIDWQMHQRSFYKRMLARCQRRWDELTALPTEKECAAYVSEMSRDLDLFGDRSLFRWVSLAATDSGAATLAQWMTRWEPANVLEERQQAVQELHSERAWRQSFWDTAFAYRGGNTSPEQLAQWGSGPAFFQNRQWLRYLSWIGPGLLLLGLLAIATGILLEFPGLATLGFLGAALGLAMNLLFTMTVVGRVHDVFVRIGSASRELQALANLIAAIESFAPTSPLLVRLRHDLEDTKGRASSAIASLRSRMRFAGMQRNPIFFIPYLILQLALLWDVRVLESLESWRHRHGESIGRWIRTLAHFEVLASSAAIADEHPDWAYPTWSASPDRNLTVSRIAHPLIPEAKRVANDVSMEESHPLLLVTGSNMAGKSTLLRSLGVNTILSRLGAPVACTAWSGPNSDIATSIRVQDSLQDGVSFFMAELKRLRSVVDTARRQQCERGIPMMVLLDEILQGTNSRERQIAVESVLTQLVQLHCLVITSTHDLELAGVPAITRIAQVVHFREFFEAVDGTEVMRFDYLMRPGVTPTTNALKLLELVGLHRNH
jgi:hypothetical protein